MKNIFPTIPVDVELPSFTPIERLRNHDSTHARDVCATPARLVNLATCTAATNLARVRLLLSGGLVLRTPLMRRGLMEAVLSWRLGRLATKSLFVGSIGSAIVSTTRLPSTAPSTTDVPPDVLAMSRMSACAL